jgi:hypothetical protein
VNLVGRKQHPFVRAVPTTIAPSTTIGPTSHFLATSDRANMGPSRPFGGWLETRGNAVHWSLRQTVALVLLLLPRNHDRNWLATRAKGPAPAIGGPMGVSGPAGGIRYRRCD